MATHVCVLNDGRLVQFGTPRDIYENPNSVYVASRLGQPRINILPGGLFGTAPKGAHQIGLRPEHVAQGDGREARVDRLERLGDHTRLHLHLDGHDIITLADPHADYAPGSALKIAPQDPLCFDAQGDRIY